MAMSTERAKAMLVEAERLYRSGDIESAGDRYLTLMDYPHTAPISMYRLACISNFAEDPLTAHELYYRALAMKPNLMNVILPENHPNRHYVFEGKKEEIVQESCALCGGKGEALWCYCMLEVGSAHLQDYNPVRLWMRCESCNHIYAREYPDPKAMSSPDAPDGKPMKTDTNYFPYYSEVLNKLMRYSPGTEYLEVGIGGSAFMLTAREMGLNVFGVDIAKGNVSQAQAYGMQAQHLDFMAFETERKWDIIVLGDVIEHVSDPAKAMEKIHGLLNDDGVVWISTPNFDAAFSHVAGHSDPMRGEGSHVNYFSRDSLFKLLSQTRFVPAEYRVSSHYNGSMEVIAVKAGYNRQD